MAYVCHFSCGATSAIATAIAIKKHGDAEIIYADTSSEHPDNLRFLRECEDKLFGKKVKILHSEKYKDIFHVFEERRFLASPSGAPCTMELKKIPIRDYLGSRIIEDVQVFGFDVGERARVDRFKQNNPEVTLYLPLVEHGLSKRNCLALLEKFNIELPAMYKLGYSNANCVGCVKAENLRYWAAIREDFPDTFKWYAEFERKIGRSEDGVPVGAAINKKYVNGERVRVFLDELPEDIEPDRSIDIFCGYSCGKAIDLLASEEHDGVHDLDEIFGWMNDASQGSLYV